MSNQIRILIVEDFAADAELMLRELQRAGISCDTHRVETAVEYRRELEEFSRAETLTGHVVGVSDGDILPIKEVS